MTKLLSKIRALTVIRSIRYGLVTLIPILTTGAFALALKSLPIEGYQDFITSFCGGILFTLFDGMFKITFEMLAVYTAAVVGYHYGILHERQDKKYGYATLLVSMGCFFILSGVPECGFDVLAAKGMFTAILAACASSFLFVKLSGLVQHRMLLTDGADVRLGFSVQMILPAAVTLSLFAALNRLLIQVFEVSSVYELLTRFFSGMFSNIDNEVLRGLFFVFLSGILWFFGMHGGNMLDGVANDFAAYSAQVNQELIAQGGEATQILSKQLMDNFVLMGGCGTTICLLAALLLFSRRSNTRQIAKMAVFPMAFNINEIMVFGLPIIYNPVFLIPFLCTPVVCFLVTYISMRLGIVPPVTYEVQWTTPVILSGYMATGSIAGSLLQLVNMGIGVAIYAPFVKRYDAEKQKVSKRDYQALVARLEESERTRIPVSLTDVTFSYGWMGKALAADLQLAMERDELQLHYQPQFHADGRCIGAEALLRWNHKMFGSIYPPLVFQLAGEAGFLEELEKWVVSKAAADIQDLCLKYPDRKLKISANVTGISIQSKSFEKFLVNLSRAYPMKEMGMCIEITEQAALHLDDNLRERFRRIREMGFMLAVDDFSMGSTSIQYLTGNYFDLLKLDGSLVKRILENPRCCEIISSIIQLSHTLELKVLAEYVSDAAIQKKLLELGCYLYQGWYYSPAITLEEFEALLQKSAIEVS